MEVASLALSAVQTVLTALDDRQLNVTLSSIIGHKSQIEGLKKKTVRGIDCVLRSAAEIKVKLSPEEQNLIEEFKDIIFEADDLLDEFVTLAHKKKLWQIDGTISEKVKLFFSPSNKVYRMAKGVKKIQKKLDAIASDFCFSFKIDPKPIRKRSRETCSYVDPDNIIGREDDLEKIVGMLLDSTVEGDVSFLAIVGMGGLGKTALAQLVYNDPRVTSSFPLRLWTCVSDQDQIQLDIEGILRKMLDEAIGGKKGCSSFEQVQRKLREQLQSNKYLVVLDDFWTESCVQWRELVKYLICHQGGSSRIMVTTRSQKTAAIVGGGEMMYELHGLSKEDSWCLFEKMALGSDLSNPPNDLVEIGREIVNGCAGVPFAIRVAGSLLYGQDKSKWHLVQRIGLANIRESKNDIMPILKLSFHHLESSLKSCFSYCAMFPKDYVMYKKKLISLWMAQSYIVPLDVGQSVADAGEEYFSILVKRCFFQDIKTDEDGEIESCKIHDLMHDIAQDVSGKEIYATNVIRGDIDKKVRHLSFSTRGEYGKYSLGKGTHIRSHLFVKHPYSDFIYTDEQIVVKPILENCRCLRALDLSGINLTSLPHCIGELLYLRYLDLSCNTFEVLPKSITNLCNLQTLDISKCYTLQELLKGLGRLVNLRDLNTDNCYRLNCMGMGELSWLQRLSNINVGDVRGCSSWKQLYDELEDLKPLNSLKGHLHIRINWPGENDIYDVEEDNRMEELYMLSKEHLISINIDGYAPWNGYDERRSRLMKGLQPHPNLKHLKIYGCSGVRTISWVSHLPNLVSLDIQYCPGLKYLPSLQNLLYLKSLSIRDLDNLEYILEGGTNNSNSTMHVSSADQVSMFFPSLEELQLCYLAKFKGWRRVVQGAEDSSEPEMQLNYFSQLKSLTIYKCPGITTCPSVEKLHLDGFNSGLQNKEEKVAESSSISYIPRLREVNIDKVAWLTSSLPMESFLYLKSLTIYFDKELVNLPDRMQYLAHLQTLRISGCQRLEAMPNWMPKLTSLHNLRFEYCSQVLMKRCQKHPPGGEDWPCIQHIPDIQFSFM